jgi:outer membrane beta-barrel protein
VSRTIWGVVIATLCLMGGVVAAEPTAPPVGLCASASGTSTKAVTGESGPAKPSDAPLPSCLDQTIAGELGASLKPRGVQKKNFLKRHKINLVAHGGLYGGDLTSSTWIGGGSLGIFLTEDFGLAGEFDLTPLTLDLDAPLNKFFNDNRFKAGMAYVALGNAIWAPIHAKLKLGGGIVHSDIMFFAGGGRMIHDAVQGLTFDAGAAIDLFVTTVLTVRLDARDLMAIEEIAGETRFTHNLVGTAGLALWIPTGW